MFFHLSRLQWSVVFSFVCMFVLGISDNIRGPLYPELIQHFNLTNTQGAWSFALASGSAFLGNISAVYLLRIINLDKVLTFSLFLMMSGLYFMGFAHDFNFYLLGCFVFGHSMGIMGVSQNLLITENVPQAKQSSALSGLHSIYGFSSLLAPLLASRSPKWFSQQNHFQLLTGWQSAFFVAAAIATAMLVVILLVRARPQFELVKAHHLVGDKKKSRGHMLWFAGFFATYVGAEILVSTRLALYMRTYFNFDLEQSSNYVTYFFVFLLLGRVVFTLKTFKATLRKQLNISLILSTIFLCLGLTLHPFFLTLVGLAMAPFYPLAVSYISEKTAAQKRRYLTFVMGIQGLSVIAMHIGVGYLADIFGLVYAFGVGIVLLLVAIFCLNFHPEIEKAMS